MHLINPSDGVALGIASTIKVIISHSDDAFGVVQFDQVSLTKLATEAVYEPTSVVMSVSLHILILGYLWI